MSGERFCFISIWIVPFALEILINGLCWWWEVIRLTLCALTSGFSIVNPHMEAARSVM